MVLRSSPGAVLGRTGQPGDTPLPLDSVGIDLAGRLVAGSPDRPIDWPQLQITLHGARRGAAVGSRTPAPGCGTASAAAPPAAQLVLVVRVHRLEEVLYHPVPPLACQQLCADAQRHLGFAAEALRRPLPGLAPLPRALPLFTPISGCDGPI